MPNKEGLVTAEGEQYHHLVRVLRVKAGDMIDVRLPNGKMMKATVCALDNKIGKVIMQEVYSNDSSGEKKDIALYPPEITLLQFIARPQKMEIIVRQAVECAVKNVVPVIGEYSQAGCVKPLLLGPTPRMERIIKEAMEQSGSPSPPAVTRAMKLEEAIDWWKNNIKTEDSEDKSIAFVLSERGVDAYNKSEKCRILKGEVPRYAAVAVGSEGGIGCGEEKVLNTAGFFSVHFNCNIMRCETAALYGVAAVREILRGKKWQ